MFTVNFTKNTSTVLAEGTGTSGNGYDAYWSTYNNSSGSYSFQAAARTYFSNGNYSDQKYSSNSWN